MSMSLRDQLLQAGLITKKQAEEANRQQHHQRKRPDKKAAADAERRRAEERQRAEKLARDAELNRIAREKAEQKAHRAEIKQLVDQNRLPPVTGDDLYNFLDGKKIRRIPVTPQMRQQLGDGRLAIVRSEGRYAVVPADIAERVAEREARALVFRGPAPEAAAPAQDDPYKDYVVPDDLVW